MPQKNYVILDVDVGVDDALAWMLLHKIATCFPWVVILGVTTTFGNVSLTTSTRNVLGLNRVAKQATPVYAGAKGPLSQPRLPFPADIHGLFGLGEQELGPGTMAPEKMSASQFMSAAVRRFPHQVTIIAVAPLTNIATTMRRDPMFARLVRRLVVMGAALQVPGNITPEAEFNVYADRLAAKIVLESCIPKIVVGLDVTTNMVLFTRDIERIRKCNPLGLGEVLHDALTFYAEFHQRSLRFQGVYFHDAMATLAAFWPSIFELVPSNIHVDVRTGKTSLAEGTCSLVATAVHAGELFNTFWNLVCEPCPRLVASCREQKKERTSKFNNHRT